MSIDPVEFGKVLARLDAQDLQLAELRSENKAMRDDVRRLLAMANQGRGSLFVLMGIGSIVGGLAIEVLKHFFFGGK